MPGLTTKMKPIVREKRESKICISDNPIYP